MYSMTIGSVMLLLHVLSAFGLIAGALGRNITYGQAVKATDLSSIHALLKASESFENILFFPATLVVFVFGLLTAWQHRRPLFGFLQGAEVNWLFASLAIWLVLGIVIPIFLAPRRRQRKVILEEALAQGTVTPSLTAALQDRVVPIMRLVELVGLGIIIILMVMKPF